MSFSFDTATTMTGGMFGPFGTTTPSTGFSFGTNKSIFGSNNAGQPVESQKVKLGVEEAKTKIPCSNICSECKMYKDEGDARNMHFSDLVQRELLYIPPCVRTKVYEQVLNLVHATKKDHVTTN